MSQFKPSNFGVGGGLVDDVDIVIKAAAIVNFDYQGSSPVPVPAIEFTLGIPDGEDVIQYWSIGKSSDWIPSEDGEKIVSIGRATQINSNSNAAILLKSLVDAGFPEDKITDKITCFVGLEGHMIRVPAPLRKGIAKKTREDGQVFEQTILTVASITKMPWEKKTGAAKPGAKSPAAGKGKPAPQQPEEGEDDLTSKTQEVLMTILGDNPDGVKKQQLPGLIFKAVGADKDRNAMVQMAFKDEFLGAGPWTYEKGVISM
jgi:hypothetical protein